MVDKINAVSGTTNVNAHEDTGDVIIESNNIGTTEYIRLVRMGSFDTVPLDSSNTTGVPSKYRADASAPPPRP